RARSAQPDRIGPGPVRECPARRAHGRPALAATQLCWPHERQRVLRCLSTRRLTGTAFGPFRAADISIPVPDHRALTPPYRPERADPSGRRAAVCPIASRGVRGGGVATGPRA